MVGRGLWPGQVGVTSRCGSRARSHECRVPPHCHGGAASGHWGGGRRARAGRHGLPQGERSAVGVRWHKGCLNRRERRRPQHAEQARREHAHTGRTVTWLSYLRDCVPTRNRMASVSAVCGLRARAWGEGERGRWRGRGSQAAVALQPPAPRSQGRGRGGGTERSSEELNRAVHKLSLPTATSWWDTAPSHNAARSTQRPPALAEGGGAFLKDFTYLV